MTSDDKEPRWIDAAPMVKPASVANRKARRVAKANERRANKRESKSLERGAVIMTHREYERWKALEHQARVDGTEDEAVRLFQMRCEVWR